MSTTLLRLLLPLAACSWLVTAPAQGSAPAEQQTSAGLTAGFATSVDGWTGNVAHVAHDGHAETGALSFRSAGARTGAASPPFVVRPGLRYRAGAWVRAHSEPHAVSLTLEFRDAGGAVVGSLVGQALASRTQGWTAASDVLGFAPSTAATARVLVLDVDGPVGDVQLVDDVYVASTSGAPAPLVGPLSTSGPHILDADGSVVRLRGVEIDGLQASSTASVGRATVRAAQSWGANLVRIPLAQNYWLAGDCSYDSGYQARVDALVTAATERGTLALLDLHTLAVIPCTQPRQQSLPDSRAVTFWRQVASRYAGNPLVAFDLYNEPHDITDAVWRDGGTVLSGGVRYQAVGMQKLYDTVRATGADNLVFTSGPNWAASYPLRAPLRGTRNLVHAVHVYTCPRGTPESGAKCSTGPDGTVLDPTGVLSRFDGLTSAVPLVLTEFGYPSAQEGRFNARAIDYVTSRGWAGWSAFTFDGGTTGMFSLWKNSGTTIDPNIAGMPVMQGMLAS